MKENERVYSLSTLFLIIYQLAVIISVPIYLYFFTPSLALVITTIVLFFATGMSITSGYHRLFSHKSYSAHPIVEFVLLFLGSMALQGSALRWAFDHRIHHAYVDTDEDPYSIKKGFWYAHCLWLLDKQKPINEKVVADLMKNRLVQFQHRYDILCMTLSNVFMWLLLGWILNDYLGAIILAIGFRTFAVHHVTWFINSLAHTWGDRPFCQEQTAVNNYVVALLTFGEGYHNYHHTFANDYRNGIRWYHFDPTKWLIWFLYKIGLAKNLKTVDEVTIKKRLISERKNLLLDAICKMCISTKEDLELKVNELSERLMTQMNSLHSLVEQYRSCTAQEKLIELQKELSDIRKNIKEDWSRWSNLSSNILNYAGR